VPEKPLRKRLRSINFAYEQSRWGTFIFKATVNVKKAGFCLRLTPSWESKEWPLADIRHYYWKASK